MGVVDRGPLSKVCQGLATLRSTKQDSVGAGRGPQGKLVEGDALSTSSDNTLACILGEGESTNTQLRALKHTDIICDLSNDNSDLAILVGHVLGKTVKTDRRSVDLTHVQTLGDGGAESRVGTTSKELVKLDKKTVVGVLRLDNLHRRFVAGTAASCFKINSHGC